MLSKEFLTKAVGASKAEEVLAKLEAVRDAKELQALAQQVGQKLSDDEAQEAFRALSGECEVTDEEMEQVAGGGAVLELLEGSAKAFGHGVEALLKVVQAFAVFGTIVSALEDKK